jgi:AcrR family transcriptional regulator
VAKGISRERIVQTALELLDEEGIDGVTARALAQRLGVQAPALYWHMASKQEILDEMGTEIRRRMAAELAAAPEPEDWRSALADYARVVRRAYLRYRDGARTFSGTRVTDPEVLRIQQHWMERCISTGLELADAVTAVQLVTDLVVGFVIEEQLLTGTSSALLTDTDEVIAEEVPLVASGVQLLHGDPDARFEQYLDIALTGLAVRFAGAPEPG